MGCCNYCHNGFLGKAGRVYDWRIFCSEECFESSTKNEELKSHKIVLVFPMIVGRGDTPKELTERIVNGLKEFRNINRYVQFDFIGYVKGRLNNINEFWKNYKNELEEMGIDIVYDENNVIRR